ncbi:MAG: conjugal transfer protein TraX [Oscillospiraceae bacterium]|jgi:hypothetical protein|nr:conjugal transfer protein TraX [Oscillospiraceae bacterium]
MSALVLRIIACVCMLCDHIGLLLHIEPLRIIGRLAFPIFLFLIFNGYQHTRSRVRYALRLFLFALLSQIPFSLFTKGVAFPLPTNLNVFFTLLLGLLCIWSADFLRKDRLLRLLAWLPFALVFGLFYFGVLRADYGPKGILMAFTFWLFYGKGIARGLLTTLGVFVSVFHGLLISYAFQLAFLLLGRQANFVLPTRWQALQLFSLLALPLIFAYNGKRGRLPKRRFAAKSLQLGFYFFYPVHLILLWLLF